MNKIIFDAENQVKQVFGEIEETEFYNSQKVIDAFREFGVNEAHFMPTTGYGYDDLGRDTLDKIYAKVFGAEDALVRHNIISGTHAITLCMFAVLRPGDLLVSVTGKPYDTLEEAIGIRGSANGNLKEYNVSYEQVELGSDGMPDYEEIERVLLKKPKAVLIQRSKGYGWRKSFSYEDIKKLITFIKERSDACVIVDNCYGEFVQKHEPTECGADLMAGSLIKNPGGGLAPTGGYVAGKAKYVEMAADRLTSPGIGKECGASLGISRDFYRGFFFAPSVVAAAVKTAVLSSMVFKSLGYEVCPEPFEERCDIIQAIKFNDEEKLKAFCRGIQKGAPVDSNVVPEPWDMPGYEHKVIMAAGAFVQGSSIELSADGPIKPPYIAYQQGGLTYPYGKIGVSYAVEELEKLNS